MIKEYSLKALQKAINYALSLDEQALTKLPAFHHKLIEVIIVPLHVNFFITFEQHTLQLLAETNRPPDTIIHSSPLGLIRLSLLPSSQARSLFNEKIRVSGDVELGQKIKQLFDGLDIDWEGHLAHFTGDMVAYQIGSLFRQGLAFKKRFSDSMRNNVSDYLQQELRLLPSKEEVDDFFNDVDQLAQNVERLQAQITLLLDHDEIH